MVPLIIMVGADKGGVGKTTITRTLLEYMRHHSVPYRSFDTEWPLGDLKRFEESEIIDINQIQDQMKVFDTIDSAKVTVVDVRAGLLSHTIKTLEDAQLLNDVKNGNMKLILLHVLGPSLSSISEVTDAANRMGPGVFHYLVKNHINDTKFFEWEQGAILDVFTRMKDVVVNIPKLTEIACEKIQQAGGNYSDFIKNSPSRMLRGNVKTWLDSCWAEYDRVKIDQICKG